MEQPPQPNILDDAELAPLELLVHLITKLWHLSPPSVGRLARTSTLLRRAVASFLSLNQWHPHEPYSAWTKKRVTLNYARGSIIVTRRGSSYLESRIYVIHMPHVSLSRCHRPYEEQTGLHMTIADGPDVGARYRVTTVLGRQDPRAYTARLAYYSVTIERVGSWAHSVEVDYSGLPSPVDHYPGLTPMPIEAPTGSSFIWLPQPVFGHAVDHRQAQTNHHVLAVYHHLATRCYPWQQQGDTRRIWASYHSEHRKGKRQLALDSSGPENAAK
jgi:hypothetical protein